MIDFWLGSLKRQKKGKLLGGVVSSLVPLLNAPRYYCLYQYMIKYYMKQQHALEVAEKGRASTWSEFPHLLTACL